MENIRGIEELKQQYPLYFIKYVGEIFGKDPPTRDVTIKEKELETAWDDTKWWNLAIIQDKGPEEA